MKLAAWSPDKVYLKPMQAKTTPEEQYREYINQRDTTQHGKAPAFFLDCAHFFFQSSNPAAKQLGVRVITTLADLKLEDQRLLRIIGQAMYLEGRFAQARWLLERVLKLRGEEPQSYRELGLVQVAQGEFALGLETLWKVITGDWQTRFQHIEDEVLLEINRTIWLARKAGRTVDTSFIPPVFIGLMPLDVHCTITWDTDDTCIDLHIDQPDGTTCNYGNHMTPIGGWSTPDYPGCTAYSTSMLREFMIRAGFPGKYTLRCNYYSNYRQDLTGGTTIWFTVFTNYCTDREQRLVTTLRLECNSASPTSHSMYTIGEVAYGHSPAFQKWEAEFEAEARAAGMTTKKMQAEQKK